MSDEQERDAALVARRREWYDTATAYMAAQEMPAIAWGIQWEKDLLETGAWLRTIDRLTAERDAARAELAKLKETVRQETLNLESLANWFDLDSDYRSRLERLRDAVTAIRSALGSEIN